MFLQLFILGNYYDFLNGLSLMSKRETASEKNSIGTTTLDLKYTK